MQHARRGVYAHHILHAVAQTDLKVVLLGHIRLHVVQETGKAAGGEPRPGAVKAVRQEGCTQEVAAATGRCLGSAGT